MSQRWYRPMINKPPPFKGRNIRIPIRIPIEGRGFIHQGSTLVQLKACILLRVLQIFPHAPCGSVGPLLATAVNSLDLPTPWCDGFLSVKLDMFQSFLPLWPCGVSSGYPSITASLFVIIPCCRRYPCCDSWSTEYATLIWKWLKPAPIQHNITPIYPLYTLLYYSSFHFIFHYPYINPI